jgi:hypothetical protein
MTDFLTAVERHTQQLLRSRNALANVLREVIAEYDDDPELRVSWELGVVIKRARRALEECR